MRVKKSSVFPGRKERIFSLLQRPKVLSYIAWPYATFTGADGQDPPTWKEGETYGFTFKLFGVLPLGIHRIQVKEFSPHRIYTQEGNPFVPIWNHEITLEKIAPDTTRYKDEVEINAGWKTPFVFLWASAFYTHRQKKWKKILTHKKTMSKWSRKKKNNKV